VFITAVRADEYADVFADEPPITNQPVDGWDPQDWYLETDLPLETHPIDGFTALSEPELHWISAWNEFVEIMWEEREGRRLPGFPLWGDSWVKPRSLVIEPGTPAWKADFMRKNSEFFAEHEKVIRAWAKRWNFYSDAFPASRRKLEWQAQDAPNLWSTVMHFRPSGIRVKRPTYLPALVAITQTSIIGSQGRRITTREAARLQGLPDWFVFGDQAPSTTYRQLGNGVSVGAVWHVMRQAVEQSEEILKKTCPALVRAVQSGPVNPDDVFRRGPTR